MRHYHNVNINVVYILSIIQLKKYQNQYQVRSQLKYWIPNLSIDVTEG